MVSWTLSSDCFGHCRVMSFQATRLEEKPAACFWERFFSLTEIYDSAISMSGIMGIILPLQVNKSNMLRGAEKKCRKNLHLLLFGPHLNP